MNCEHCQELLPGYEQAELSPDMQAAVTVHLQTCAACTQAAVALRELNALLDVETVASPGLRRQVLARLEQEAGQRKGLSLATLFTSLWPSKPLGAFSYSLALVLCGMFSGQLLPLAANADLADIPAERLVQLCPVPDGPRRDIL